MKLSTLVRTAVGLGALCAAFAAPSLLAVRAQSFKENESATSLAQTSPDRSSPAATLRSFASALTRADLSAAAACVEGGKRPNNFAEIETAMRQVRTEYSIYGEPKIEMREESARALSLFTISRPPNKSGLPSDAILRQENGVWKIDVARTFRQLNGVTQWTAFLGLLTGRSVHEVADGSLQYYSSRENRRSMAHMEMMRVLSEAATSLAYDRGKFDLRAGDVRRALRPYYPPLDAVLGMDASTRVSFNRRLQGVSIRDVRTPEHTVLFYTGRNEHPDFDQSGKTWIAYASGYVRRIRRDETRFLLWKPSDTIETAWPKNAPNFAREYSRLKAWAAARGQAVITGRVRYENGLPAANVSVNIHLRSLDEKTGRLLAPGDPKLWSLKWAGHPRGILPMLHAGVRTRADGTFRATGLTTGTYDIYLSGGGLYANHDLRPQVPQWVVTRNAVVQAREKRTSRASDIVYTRGALIEARVVDAESGAAIKGGAGFWTLPVSFNSFSGNNRWFLLDKAGRVQLRVPTGAVQIAFVADGNRFFPDVSPPRIYRSERGSYDLGKTTVEVDGQVLRRTGPASVGLQIVRGQPRRVTFRLRKYQTQPETSSSPIWMPRGTAILEGRVLDERGRPASNIPVLAFINSSTYVKLLDKTHLNFSGNLTQAQARRQKQLLSVYEQSAVTRADGTFRISGLTTAHYTVAVTRRKHGISSLGFGSPPALVAKAAGVWAKEGRTTRLATPLVVTRGAVIKGRVVDKTTGQPLSGVIIAGYGPHSPPAGGRGTFARSNNAGEFALRVAPGVTAFSVSGPNVFPAAGYRFADTGEESRTSFLGTSRGIYAGGSMIHFQLDGGKTQPGGVAEVPLRIETQRGQTRRLTIFLRRVIAAKR